eukprot:6475994-Amphidinium_carterae.2
MVVVEVVVGLVMSVAEKSADSPMRAWKCMAQWLSQAVLTCAGSKVTVEELPMRRAAVEEGLRLFVSCRTIWYVRLVSVQLSAASWHLAWNQALLSLRKDLEVVRECVEMYVSSARARGCAVWSWCRAGGACSDDVPVQDVIVDVFELLRWRSGGSVLFVGWHWDVIGLWMRRGEEGVELMTTTARTGRWSAYTHS